MSATAERIATADQYLNSRTGCYEMRCGRYDAALEAMHQIGLDDSCTVLDVGAGMGEFGVRLHTGYELAGWSEVLGANRYARNLEPSRARYWPVDAALDGTDLETWRPPRRVEFVVCLEVLEHLRNARLLLSDMVACSTRGVVVSTPNPATTDVLGMDPTHVQPCPRSMFEQMGFYVEPRSFYGQPDDSLFAVWSA